MGGEGDIMGADLHIHVYEGLTEGDLRNFFGHTLGSKYFSMFMQDHKRWEEAYTKISETNQMWIGSVSWLKAGLFEDEESFVPQTVGEISELIGEELPVLDDELIEKILNTFDLPNVTGYSLNDKEKVREWLMQNKGKQIFTVSW